ncbi:Eukaryotic aspartyl protease [Aphelenchoides besseyi]|nr:Eukaryotic aspartyl protease [Aphelenchoides besseyi]
MLCLLILLYHIHFTTGSPFLEFKAPGPFYSIPLRIGMPPQEVNVTIDTTAHLTFVYAQDSQCYGEAIESCIPHVGYDYRKSNTLKDPTTKQTFETPLGEAKGILVKEFYTLGPYGMTDTPATIGVANEVISYMNRKIPASGFISMFAPVHPVDSPDASHMQTLSSQSQAAIVSLFTPRCGTEMHSVTIGKSDDTNCKSDWIDFPLVPDTKRRWIIQLDNISWGPTINRQNVQAILSTAADYLLAPRSDVEEIQRMFNAVVSDYQNGSLVYSARVDCNQRRTGPVLRFDGQGRSFYMRASQYIKQYYTGVCILNIYSNDNAPNQWTLPYMFFQSNCARFDFENRTVGFSTPKNFATCSKSHK